MSQEGKQTLLTRPFIEQMLREAGHWINVNNGRCGALEDFLCRVTSVCCELLDRFDAEKQKGV